ncbi:MAG: hypothetical protein U0997_06550 [Sulfurimicrobium sp.]|nr:hypothetical protein [Sulfurimicrobium sp.]
MSKDTRIRELEMLAESYRCAANRLADELISILAPYRNGDAIATANAIRELAGKHLVMELHGGKELH